MSRASRLLNLTQMLRRRRTAITAREISEELEVSERTVYRDIASLIATGAPIRGEAGVGYVLDAGYDVPPLMFTPDELDALMLGARFVRDRGDPVLAEAADNAVAKIEAVLPASLRAAFQDAPLIAPSYSFPPIDRIDPVLLRRAIRLNRKMRIDYIDGEGRRGPRIVWPLVIGFYNSARILIAWCELRGAFRHFRTDRIEAMEVLNINVPRRRQDLMLEWQAEREREMAEYQAGGEARKGEG